MYKIFTEYNYLYAALVVTTVSVYVAIRSRAGGNTTSNSLGITCWLLETFGLCYICGFVAAKCPDARIILVAECTAMTLALIGFACGGKLINYNGENKV